MASNEIAPQESPMKFFTTRPIIQSPLLPSYLHLFESMSVTRCLSLFRAATTAPNPQPSLSPNSEINLPKKKVLITDDDPINRIVLRKLLNQLHPNLEIVEVKNGKEAVMAFIDNRFDLVFMDCDMPVMGGLSATKSIRRVMCENVPIIAMTSTAQANPRDKCLEVGMDAYLTKPLMRHAIKEVLEIWLGSGISRNQAQEVNEVKNRNTQ
jgi:CheY-like chemotaxis protein